MEYTERDRTVKSVGYESLVWVRDDKGREFSCSLDNRREGVTTLEDLTDKERASCMDVNTIIGTERW